MEIVIGKQAEYVISIHRTQQDIAVVSKEADIVQY